MQTNSEEIKFMSINDLNCTPLLGNTIEQSDQCGPTPCQLKWVIIETISIAIQILENVNCKD